MLFDLPLPSLILYDTGSPLLADCLSEGIASALLSSDSGPPLAVGSVEGESVFPCGSQGSRSTPLLGTEYETLISPFFTK